MILAHYRIFSTQRYIARLLETRPEGTPFSRISRLSTYGVKVLIGTNKSWREMQSVVNTGTPVIVAVNLLFMPHAAIDSNHVIVVVGCSAGSVTVLDPAHSSHPVVVPEDAFIAAWTEMDCAYAVVNRH